MVNSFCNQLFIEGENNQVYIYVHLDKLCEKSASKILDKYIKNFKEYSFEKINISFWEVNIPGEHLSAYRKTSNEAIGKILKGIKCIEGYFDFISNEKIINEPRYIS